MSWLAWPRLAPAKPGEVADRSDRVVEPHGHAILAPIVRPGRQAGVIRLAAAGKCDPGFVHCFGKPPGLLGLCTLEHRRVRPIREIVEHERNLDAVTRLETGGRLPVELVHVSRPPLVG